MSPPDGGIAGIHRIIDGAEEVTWPDPEPLFNPAEAEKPYPLAALPAIIGKAVSEYRAYGQQPLPMIACSALASASLSAQAIVDVARDNRLVGPVSLHFIVIAVSGERKTSVDRIFNQPIRQWVSEQRELLKPKAAQRHAETTAWAAERDGIINKIKSSAGKGVGAGADLQRLRERLATLENNAPSGLILPALFYEDTNAAALATDLAEGWPSASLWSDEGGLVIGSQGMNDENLMGFIALMNRLWDGLDHDRRRRTTNCTFIKGRRFTASLMMQPELAPENETVG
jgi:hypothetical protein